MTQIDLDKASEEVKVFFRSLPRGNVIRFTRKGRAVFWLFPPLPDADQAALSKRIQSILDAASARTRFFHPEEISPAIEAAIHEACARNEGGAR